MELKNAAEFDRVVIRVLTALAEEFPKPISLNFEVLGLADGPAYITANMRNQETQFTPQHAFAAQCVRFLADEEYISGNLHETWVGSACLTGKGLDLIKAIPNSLIQGRY
mgnify:CR=1 FL=1